MFTTTENVKSLFASNRDDKKIEKNIPTTNISFIQKNNWQYNIFFCSNKEKLSNIQIVIYILICQKKDQLYK